MTDSSLYRAILSRVRSDIRQTYHDINNPLAVLSGNIQLLEQLLVMHDTDAGVMEVVDDIRVACDRMAESSASLDQLSLELSAILDDSPPDPAGE
ncbi:MAG: hypothetical protein HKN43_09040 [Rhodothermales bacterium]|nr:hypothetical protein [Rhodothermales bacterium]